MHYLFLVDDTAVCNVQYAFHRRVQVMDFAFVEFALDVVADVLHGAGTVQADTCDNFFKPRRLHFAHKVAHAAAFKLEDAHRVARRNEVEHVGVAVVICREKVADHVPLQTNGGSLAKGGIVTTQYNMTEVEQLGLLKMAFFNQFFDKGLIERLELVANSDFGRITYTDAVELLKQHNDEFQYKVDWGTDIQTEHERYITEQVFHKPVFVTDYPKEIKSFYMRANEDGRTVAAADMLVPGIGELIGGSQREERLDVLEQRMAEIGMSTEGYEWYLELRKYGTAQHAGFGLGFERLVMYLTGIPNIRDVLPFPRTCGGF